MDWLCALRAETPVKRDPNKLMIVSSIFGGGLRHSKWRPPEFQGRYG
jgi:hypothetical protein